MVLLMMRLSAQIIINCRQDLRLCKAFANNSSANIKLSKTQLSKMAQLGGFVGPFLAFLFNPDEAGKN